MERGLLLLSVLSAVLVAHTSALNQKRLPPFIKICRKSDPHLNECVKESVEGLKPHLAKGIPEINVPPCEPLLIPEVVLNQGSSAMNIKSTYSNIKLWGPTNFHIKNIKVDLQHHRVFMRILFPHLYFTSNYEMTGRILMLPIAGKGRCHSNYTNVDAVCDMMGELNKRSDGNTYHRVTDMTFKLNIGEGNIYLTDLFNGDQLLGSAMNNFLNENWKMVSSEIIPVLEETIADIVKEMSNRIYSSTCMEILMPD